MHKVSGQISWKAQYHNDGDSDNTALTVSKNGSAGAVSVRQWTAIYFVMEMNGI